MKIFLFPIEPLEERYSAQWLRWFPRVLESLGVEVEIVMGSASQARIQTGEFLDVLDTNHFKATQVAKFVNLVRYDRVKDGDWVLLLDGWNPAVEQLAYMRDLGKVKFKIASCFHAGSYDPWDLLGQHPTLKNWAAHAEAAHLAAADRVFVATHQHAQMLANSRGSGDRIRVTGFPLYDEEWSGLATRWEIRPRRVVFPHRLATEKAPEDFDVIAELYQSTYPDDPVAFIKTKTKCATKADYYGLLGSARVAVSTALQETWGIAMLEAASLGCYPVVPDRLSYREIYDTRYTTPEQAVTQIRAALDAPVPYLYNPYRWTHAIQNMVACMEDR